MTAIIDAASGAAPVRQGDGRPAAEMRQARWLFDLEQALLEQGLKPYQAKEDAPASARPEQGEVSSRKEKHRHREQDPGSAAAAAAQEQAPQVAFNEALSGPKRREEYMPAMAGQMPVFAEHAGDFQTTSPGLVEAATINGPKSTCGNDVAVKAFETTLQRAAGATVVPGSVPQPAAWGDVASRTAGPVAATGVDNAETPAALRAAAPAQRVLAFLPSSRNADQMAEGEQVEATPPQAPPELPGEPFEKKLLHLFYGRDGVHAWVRDAELQAEQMRSLAQNLADELGGARQRLASLTVNGRKVTATAAAAREDQGGLVAQQRNTTRSIK